MVFTVKSPIPGFPHIDTVELSKIDDFFMSLHDQDGFTSFTLVNPYLLRAYEFDIPSYYKTLLEIEETTNVLVLNIMIVTTPIENSTVNFIAPLIFNTDNQTMAQILLDSEKYANFGITEKIGAFLEEEAQ